ncbi:hypothetical protein GF324_06520, partial [bacterium]|nr:hypothetical protein [bacterium]
MHRLCRVSLVLLVLLLGTGGVFAHPEMTSYEGAVSCAMCHSGMMFDTETVAREFLESAHGAFKVEVTEGFGIIDEDGNPVTGVYGKSNRYCGLPGTITHINWIGRTQRDNPGFEDGQPGGCARCHASDATFKTENIPDDAWEHVDCLLCHAETYQVNGTELVKAGARQPVSDANSPTGWRIQFPEGDDLAVTSASITGEVPTSSCERCHLYAGGGYMNKRGFDWSQHDVHANSLSCTSCHPSSDHKIAMGRTKPACWTNDLHGDPLNEEVSCTHCHSDVQNEHPHAPAHFDRIGCET